MSDILYDCYDENEIHIGIIFAKDCKDLLSKNPNVKYVRGIDAVTHKPCWHRVKENGLWTYCPKVNAHKEESDWHYSDYRRV